VLGARRASRNRPLAPAAAARQPLLAHVTATPCV
jgi:hypothetical protein